MTSEPTEYSASCPSMVPFVAAFCAEDLKCMDADKAGEGRPGAWTSPSRLGFQGKWRYYVGYDMLLHSSTACIHTFHPSTRVAVAQETMRLAQGCK